MDTQQLWVPADWPFNIPSQMGGILDGPLLPGEPLTVNGCWERGSLYGNGVTLGKLSMLQKINPTHALYTTLIKHSRSKTKKHVGERPAWKK